MATFKVSEPNQTLSAIHAVATSMQVKPRHAVNMKESFGGAAGKPVGIGRQETGSSYPQTKTPISRNLSG